MIMIAINTYKYNMEIFGTIITLLKSMQDKTNKDETLTHNSVLSS